MTLAAPFNRIFHTLDEAQIAFSLFRQTAQGLGIDGPYDPRLAVTYAPTTLRFDFCQWTLMSVSPTQLELTLLAKLAQLTNLARAEALSSAPPDSPIYRYSLPRPNLPLPEALQAAYLQTLPAIRHHFAHWQSTPYRRHHKTEIAEAIFDEDKRARLLAEGLPESDFLNERHFTAFGEVVNETSAEYGGERLNDEWQMMNEELIMKDNEMRVATPKTLAEPFATIFTDRAEAEWAFDFLAETFQHLQIDHVDDPRYSLTLPHQQRMLRFNFGRWVMFDIRHPGYSAYRIQLTMLDEYLEGEDTFPKVDDFNTKDNDPTIHAFGLTIEQAQTMSEELRYAYTMSMAHFAQKFSHYKGNTWRKYGFAELAEAVFDKRKRDQLLSYGLNTPMVELAEADFEADSTTPPYPLADLAAKTHTDEATLQQWLRALARKKQVIFYGPPGTGKSFIATELARHLIAEGDGFMETVQFHPAYAYEDFMQGLRPVISQTGQLSYEMRAGRFMQFCQQARQRQGLCVLMIDEINRANLAQVFGELMYLLEYRGQTITLAGSGRSFAIPNNVRVIGTMNTADRSIALVDHALRRRFAFLNLRPNYEALRRYHQTTQFDCEPLIALLQRLNQAIDDSHYEIGISYFFLPDLADHLPDIWRTDIEPYLEEYFFNQPKQVDAFRWEQIAIPLTPKLPQS